jgi:hypothetical protein
VLADPDKQISPDTDGSVSVSFCYVKYEIRTTPSGLNSGSVVLDNPAGSDGIMTVKTIITGSNDID